MIRFIISKNLRGPFNAVSPNPIKMSEFFSILAEIENKKKLIRIPSSIINLFLGDMARLLLVSSQRVIPKRAIDSGFLFRNTDIRKVLLNYLKV